MSTYYYFQCMSNDPPIRSETESGQHDRDLETIRADWANRETLYAAGILEYMPVGSAYFRNATLRFIMTHKDCRVCIVDEHGETHPVSG